MSNDGYRNDPLYREIAAMLTQAGIPHDIEVGANHWHLVFEIGGKLHLQILGYGSKTKPGTAHKTRAKFRSLLAARKRGDASATIAGETFVFEAAAEAEVEADTPPAPSANAIAIAGHRVDRIVHKGDRVVTFAQIDVVHERAVGTAKRTFHEHRARFVAGVDYVEVGRDVIRTDLADAGISKFAATAILLTRAGYLKITKPMQDDRSWSVFNEMVERYFTVEQMLGTVTDLSPAVRRAIGGIVKSVLPSIMAAELDARQAVPALDFGGTLSAFELIELAEVAPADRQRGTAQMVTSHMLSFCAERGIACIRTPAAVNPSRPYRFPSAVGSEWLLGSRRGLELIRAQVDRQKAKKAAAGRPTGQAALQLVPTGGLGMTGRPDLHSTGLTRDDGSAAVTTFDTGDTVMLAVRAIATGVGLTSIRLTDDEADHIAERLKVSAALARARRAMTARPA